MWLSGCNRELRIMGIPGQRIAVIIALATTSPGCSFIFTRGPEPGRYAQPSGAPSLECTSSVAAPAVDTALATLSLALVGAGIFAASAFSGFQDASSTAGVYAIIGGAATGTLFTASAVAGYQRTAACRTALESARPSPGRISR
ncbi:MAG TPA: hypothetical protein VLT82_02120 [Myxococcaceae bacterium]|nr:hypothetical protein [Myxococcaceae bacterium]